MNTALLIFLTGATPISELRGAIPLGLGLGLSPLAAYFFAVLGNAAIIVPLLAFLKYGAHWAQRHSHLADRGLTWIFNRTQRKYGARFENTGVLALAIFVAIPAPVTGAWTACIIAVLFKLPFWKSAGAILLGVLAAGVIVLALSQGVITIL